MSTPVRLLAFTALLLAVFGGATLAGGATDPSVAPASREGGHGAAAAARAPAHDDT